MAEVARGRAHQQALGRRPIRHLREPVLQVARLVVAPAAHVHDADAVALPVANDPGEAAANVVVLDPPRRAHLDEHEVRLRGQALIDATREAAVPAGHHRCHHPVPARLVGAIQVGPAGALARDVDVLDDPILGFHEVGVGEEARVEKGDGDPPPAVGVARPQAHGSGKNGGPRAGQRGKEGTSLPGRFFEGRRAVLTQPLLPAPPGVVGKDEQLNFLGEVLRCGDVAPEVAETEGTGGGHARLL